MRKGDEPENLMTELVKEVSLGRKLSGKLKATGKMKSLCSQLRHSGVSVKDIQQQTGLAFSTLMRWKNDESQGGVPPTAKDCLRSKKIHILAVSDDPRESRLPGVVTFRFPGTGVVLDVPADVLSTQIVRAIVSC